MSRDDFLRPVLVAGGSFGLRETLDGGLFRGAEKQAGGGDLSRTG